MTEHKSRPIGRMKRKEEIEDANERKSAAAKTAAEEADRTTTGPRVIFASRSAQLGLSLSTWSQCRPPRPPCQGGPEGADRSGLVGLT